MIILFAVMRRAVESSSGEASRPQGLRRGCVSEGQWRPAPARVISPVFLFAAVFKLGSSAIVIAGYLNDFEPLRGPQTLIPLAILLPALVIFLVKVSLQLENLTATSIVQGAFAEGMSLHLWPGKDPGGAR